MEATLCQFIDLRVRYGVTDENGNTRVDRNEQFGMAHLTQEFTAPDVGFYLIEWFDELRAAVNDVVDGAPVKIPWSEYIAWSRATGRIVRRAEYAILQAMHDAWRAAIGPEIEAARERAKAKPKE